MATLHISVEEFYDLSPSEFYYGAKAVGESRMALYKQQCELARYNAYLVIKP